MPEAPTPKKRLSETIRSLGDLDHDAAQELEACVHAAATTGKKATFTLALSIDPKGNLKVLITPKVTTKLPTAGTAPSMFFAGEQGELLGDHPDQMQLPFKEKTATP